MRWEGAARARTAMEMSSTCHLTRVARLCAQGHRPLGDAEWTVYRDAALEEWEARRAAREAEAAEAGASGFFNPRVRHEGLWVMGVKAHGVFNLRVWRDQGMGAVACPSRLPPSETRSV